jgi:5-formyltetrahydrofolate cyclo-ligase
MEEADTRPGKAALREKIKKTLAALPPERFIEDGKKAAAFVTGHALWRQYGTVFLFLSLPGEIDTFPLLQAAFSDSKKVFLPRIENGKLAFIRAASPFGPWRRGPFGISEPVETGESTGKIGEFPALIVTPGLAFDRNGNRLGRGGGYYDRFFAAADGRPYITAGLCMEEQILPELPADTWDKKMDAVFTAGGLTSGRLRGGSFASGRPEN